MPWGGRSEHSKLLNVAEALPMGRTRDQFPFTQTPL